MQIERRKDDDGGSELVNDGLLRLRAERNLRHLYSLEEQEVMVGGIQYNTGSGSAAEQTVSSVGLAGWPAGYHICEEKNLS